MTTLIEESEASGQPGDALLATIARATPMSTFGHVVNVTIAVLAFRGYVDPQPLLLWAATSYGVAGWVLVRWLKRRRRSDAASPSRSRNTRRAELWGAALAAPWGVLGFWLLGELPQQPELILIALCVGMSAGGSVLLSARYPSAVTYMSCILAPVALKCFVVLAGGEYRLLGALAISYGLFLLGCIGSCSKLFADRNRAVDRLRRSLSEIQTAKHEVELAHSRFDAALRNMPQGLSMFDGDDRLVAYNGQYLEIYGLRPERIAIGMTFGEVFAGQDLVPDLDAYLRDFKQRLASQESSSNTVTFPNGRVVYISYARTPGGGWVATHEDITQRKAVERKIELLAHFDGLTQLANRNLFKDRVEEALARHRRLQHRFAVMLLDLDRFKGVNDALGHHAGDALLQQVSDRIRSTVREIDVPARLGGDEFGLVVTFGAERFEQAAAALAERLIAIIGAPYDIEGHPVVIGCSIGIALVPEHGERFDEVLRNADLALYKSKHSGRSCSHFYSDSLRAEAEKRNRLEVELREAIWRDELEVHYQPVIDLRTGEVSLVEALVRWNHRELGFVAPAEFIPVAEDAGLIVDLGKLVLGKACRDVANMPRHVKVAVNLSAAQFDKGDLVDTVIAALASANLRESRLELEITEGVFLEDNAHNLETLEQLRKLGISIALDDFGVGYSSLSYLTAFPFDKVKIDKSFVQRFDRAETQTVMSSIVQLAKSLDRSVVVEGIETGTQLDKMRSLGIDFGQGYLLGRPRPAAALSFERCRFGEMTAVA